MNKLEKTIVALGILGSSLGFLNSNAQENSKKENFCFNIFDPSNGGTYTSGLVKTGYYKALETSLSNPDCSENKFFESFNGYDFDNDGLYDCAILKRATPSSNGNKIIVERFRFHMDERKIDYSFEIYKEVPEWFYEQPEFEKKYFGITQKEAYDIGEEFVERVNGIRGVFKDFSRFNTQPAEDFLHKEMERWDFEENDGKYYFVSEAFPIDKYFSKEELKEIENLGFYMYEED